VYEAIWFSLALIPNDLREIAALISERSFGFAVNDSYDYGCILVIDSKRVAAYRLAEDKRRGCEAAAPFLSLFPL
jgi:hypothetical protein